MLCICILSSEWRDEHPNIPTSRHPNEVISEGTYLESFLEDGLIGKI